VFFLDGGDFIVFDYFLYFCFSFEAFKTLDAFLFSILFFYIT